MCLILSHLYQCCLYYTIWELKTKSLASFLLLWSPYTNKKHTGMYSLSILRVASLQTFHNTVRKGGKILRKKKKTNTKHILLWLLFSDICDKHSNMHWYFPMAKNITCQPCSILSLIVSGQEKGKQDLPGSSPLYLTVVPENEAFCFQGCSVAQGCLCSVTAWYFKKFMWNSHCSKNFMQG